MQAFRDLLRLLVIVGVIDLVKGRGHLIDPPMRSSLWRFYPWNQMNVPKNVDDTGLNCGGFWVRRSTLCLKPDNNPNYPC